MPRRRTTTSSARRRAGPRLLDVALVVLTAVLGVHAVFAIADPGLRLLGFDRAFDVALQSISGAIALGVAALGISRYQADGRVTRLFQSAAWFTTFAVIVVQRATVLLGLDRTTGFAPGAASALTPWIALLPSLVVSVILLAGARRGVARSGGGRYRSTVIVIPFVALFITDLAILATRPPLPDLLDPVRVAALREISLPVDLGRFAAEALPAHTGLGLTLWLVPLLLLLLGTLRYRALALRDGPATSGWLAVSLLFLAFAQIHAIVAPTVFSGVVSWFDILLLAAVIAAFLGQVAEERADSARLRRAIIAEERLRVARTERAVLDERLRIARELHDGLSQSLWLLRMRVEGLIAATPEGATDLAVATREGLVATEEDARRLVDAMRRIEPADDLGRALAEVARDIVPEDGPEVRVEHVGGRLPALPPEVVGELRAIVREALVNSLRHADATLIRIAVDGGGGHLSVSVTDNGRGFDQDRRPRGHYGLAGMEERARSLCGTLVIRSAPEEGTVVRVEIPLAPDAPAPVAG